MGVVMPGSGILGRTRILGQEQGLGTKSVNASLKEVAQWTQLCPWGTLQEGQGHKKRQTCVTASHLEPLPTHMAQESPHECPADLHVEP